MTTNLGHIPSSVAQIVSATARLFFARARRCQAVVVAVWSDAFHPVPIAAPMNTRLLHCQRTRKFQSTAFRSSEPEFEYNLGMSAVAPNDAMN
eukprot:s1144_g18.t1